jgi:hypothetical protein
MKKIIVSLLAIAPVFAFAQFSKGTVFLGGSLSSVIQNADNKQTGFPNPSSQSNTVFAISPSIGFFVSEKMAIGSSITYSTSVQKYTYPANTFSSYTSQAEQNSVGINPYIRYYLPISSSIYFGLQGGVSFSRGNQKSTQFNGTSQPPTTEIPLYTLGASVRPIFIFFPSPKWGIEASIGSLGYTYMRDLPDAGSSNSFGLSAGSFSFGIAYYFIKK